jgi:ubiquinone/menaquinone biosynthesis C-methylase UbiE
MKILDHNTKFAHLGKPGSTFSNGFERRFQMIKKYVDLRNKKILDLGCGNGVWLSRFLEYTAPENIFGSEYDEELYQDILNNIIKNSKIPEHNISLCAGESLSFQNESFDIVFHNEVLEHVKDDSKTLQECFRVLKKGGYIIFFTPNRGWPFETHGIFLNKKYLWGNIPLIPWLPKFLSNKLIPHVRNYSNGEINSLIKNSFKDTNYQIVLHTHVFPGFDKFVKRFGVIGKLVQRIFHALEKTPFHFFGISHFIIIKKQS